METAKVKETIHFLHTYTPVSIDGEAHLQRCHKIPCNPHEDDFYKTTIKLSAVTCKKCKRLIQSGNW